MTTSFPAVLLAASNQRAIGIVIGVIVLVGFVVYLIANMRKAKPEVGNEIELAPNRKPYHADEVLEGKTLDTWLTVALILLTVSSVAIPAIWLAEPGRMENRDEGNLNTAIGRGEELYIEGAQCVNCHGPEGVGGQTEYILSDSNGTFLQSVNWDAPALNTAALRFDDEELTDILVNGRPGSPMPAWGVDGGGALNDQQISNLVEYIKSIAIEPDEAKAAVAEELARPEYDEYASLGEAVFNLGKETGFASGAYACGRCHTSGWSYDADETVTYVPLDNPDGLEPTVAALSSVGTSGRNLDRLDVGPAPAPGNGATGPSLRDGATITKCETKQHIALVTIGSEDGKGYCKTSQGSGRMPGFGEMFTEEQIAAVVAYERSLGTPQEGVAPAANVSTDTDPEDIVPDAPASDELGDEAEPTSTDEAIGE